MRVEVRDVTKRFGGTAAISHVTLKIAPGSIHGLIGENGAGKSTLAKIIGGALRPDSGEVIVDGRLRVYHSPRDASRDGIALLTQELALVPYLTVRDNVLLGIQPTVAGLLSKKASQTAFSEATRAAGFTLPPDALVADLSIAEQQKVEILRAMSRKAQVIVLDEPTSSLTQDQIAKLHRVVRDLRAAGTTIIYVSHSIGEILELADDITVLRNGKLVRSRAAMSESVTALIKAMIGNEAPASSLDRPPRPIGAPIALSVRGLTCPGAIEDVSFDIRAGEIVGLAGLVGSGRSSVARAIFGADRPARGFVEVGGVRVPPGSPRRSVKHGLAFVPEDRKTQGLELVLSQMVNVSLPHLQSLSTAGVVAVGRERRETAVALHRFDVRPVDLNSPVSDLSGGNQQKVLFAKWLLRKPKVLLLDEPTRGVDVGARHTIHEFICSVARDGTAILLISSDLDEVLALAHEVLVMRSGRVVADFDQPISAEAVLEQSFGSSPAGTLAGLPGRRGDVRGSD